MVEDKQKFENRRVTVILPTHNDLDLAKRALNSVASQTYPITQVIVVDDGSDVVVRREDLTSNANLKIQLVRTDGVGLASARNLGLKYSVGEYISFLDADDYWSSTKIENQMDLISKTPEAVAVFSGCLIFDDKNRIIKKIKPAAGIYNTVDIIAGKTTISGSASSILTWRSAIVALGGFNENLDYAEDMDMWLRLSRQGAIIAAPYLDVYIYENPKSMQRNQGNSIRLMRDLDYRIRILNDYPEFSYEVRSQLIRAISAALIFGKIKYTQVLDIIKRNNQLSSVRTITNSPIFSTLLLSKNIAIDLLIKSRNFLYEMNRKVQNE